MHSHTRHVSLFKKISSAVEFSLLGLVASGVKLSFFKGWPYTLSAQEGRENEQGAKEKNER